MNFLMNFFNWQSKRLLYFLLGTLIILLILFSLWIFGLHWLSQKIDSKRAEIQKMIDEQLGAPTSIESIKTHTQLTGICLALNNVVVKDAKTAAPFVKIHQIELYPNLIQSFLQKTLVLKKIQLQGLKLHFIWDNNKEKFRLSGFQGEALSLAEGDYRSTLGSLALQYSLFLNEAEIEWQGETTQVLQRLTGEFSWVSPETKSFQFTGNQALKINQGDFFKPTPLDFSFDPITEQVHVATGLANAAIRFQYNPSQGLDGTITADQLDLASLHHNLILNETDPAWMKWLVTALPKGFAEGQVKMLGPLENLNWNGELRYRKLTLQYSPHWPAVENAAGSIELNNEVIKIAMNRGEIVGTPIDKVTAVIAPVGTETSSVTLAGDLSGDLENGLEFLKQSPLENVYKNLANLNPKGGMDLKLELKIPLNDKPTEVKGVLKVKQGHLTLKEFNLPIEQMNGTFEFTEKGISTKEPVQALFLKRPLLIRASQEGITAETYLTMDFIQKQFHSVPLKYFEGGSNITLVLPPDETKWIIKSDLKGVGIHLPPPLYKKPEDSLPMSLEVRHVSAKETQFALQAPKHMSAKWKMAMEKKKPALKNAHIVLGQGNSDWITQNAILINGTIPSLDVKEWQDFIETQTEVGSLKLPVSLHILVSHLQAFSIEFSQTWINFDSRKPHIWSLEGPLLMGDIYLPTAHKNSLLLDLDYLNLSQNENEKHNVATKFLNLEERIPISFSCKALHYDSHHFGQVNFHLEPIKIGYAIQEFTAKAKDFTLEGKGEWKISDQNTTTLKGQLLSDNMGAALNRIGFASIDGGNGRIRFDFQWDDTPFDFAMKKVQGFAAFQITNGLILGFDPGLGKVIGLLSLDSIQRLLQFNLKDVVKKGLAFDIMGASLKFQRGIATTEDFMVDGPVAKIGLAGQVNLATKGLNLNMSITPKIMSSSLPIAASIATANPAVGIGVWMVDKMTGSKLTNLAQYHYQITGTWDSPNIQEVRKLGPSRRGYPPHRRRR